jgi:hypothetical protein
MLGFEAGLHMHAEVRKQSIGMRLEGSDVYTLPLVFIF